MDPNYFDPPPNWPMNYHQDNSAPVYMSITDCFWFELFFFLFFYLAKATKQLHLHISAFRHGQTPNPPFLSYLFTLPSMWSCNNIALTDHLISSHNCIELGFFHRKNKPTMPSVNTQCSQLIQAVMLNTYFAVKQPGYTLLYHTIQKYLRLPLLAKGYRSQYIPANQSQ